jgi:hypothetical protein
VQEGLQTEDPGATSVADEELAEANEAVIAAEQVQLRTLMHILAYIY